MCALVVICHKFNRDPDNIVPAVASCLGDLVTLVMLGFVSALFIPFIQTPLPLLVGIFVIFSAIACFVFTMKNKHVRPLLKVGWWPLLGAMVISSGTGIVLDMFVSRYEGFALLAIVISGMFLPQTFKHLHLKYTSQAFRGLQVLFSSQDYLHLYMQLHVFSTMVFLPIRIHQNFRNQVHVLPRLHFSL